MLKYTLDYITIEELDAIVLTFRVNENRFLRIQVTSPL